MIPLPSLRSLIMPALMAGVIGFLGYKETRKTAVPVSGSAVSIGSAVITVQQPCPPEPAPAPDPSPAPLPPPPVPCPCPDPSPVPAPTPTPVPVPPPVPPTPPAPVVTGPIFATLIYDATSTDPALLAIKNDEPNLQVELAKIDAAWHAWTRDSSMVKGRILPRLTPTIITSIADGPYVVIQDQAGEVAQITPMPKTSTEIIDRIKAFRGGN